METGIVEQFNNRTGGFIVRCSDGMFAYFKLLAPQDPQPGDVLQWGDRQARTVLKNLTAKLEGIHVEEGHFGLTRPEALMLLDAVR